MLLSFWQEDILACVLAMCYSVYHQWIHFSSYLMKTENTAESQCALSLNQKVGFISRKTSPIQTLQWTMTRLCIRYDHWTRRS